MTWCKSRASVCGRLLYPCDFLGGDMGIAKWLALCFFIILSITSLTGKSSAEEIKSYDDYCKFLIVTASYTSDWSFRNVSCDRGEIVKTDNNNSSLDETHSAEFTFRQSLWYGPDCKITFTDDIGVHGCNINIKQKLCSTKAGDINVQIEGFGICDSITYTVVPGAYKEKSGNVHIKLR